MRKNSISTFLFDKPRRKTTRKRSLADLRYKTNSFFELVAIMAHLKLIKQETKRAVDSMLIHAPNPEIYAYSIVDGKATREFLLGSNFIDIDLI